MKVSELMTQNLCTIASGMSVFLAAELMNKRKIGSLLVEDRGEIVGILTSRDIRTSHPNRIAADAMTSNLYTIAADSFVWDALQVMEQYDVERLIVTANDKIQGLVTRETIKVCMSRFIDPLTGLYRSEPIRYMTEHFLEQKKAFQFLFVDLDNFGDINKRYGHPVGDDFLQRFSTRLQNLQQQDVDYVCRYAGDEFIYLTLRNEEETVQLIEQITCPLIIGTMRMQATVGSYFASEWEGESSLSFRDIVTRSSLRCSSTKQQIS